MRFSKKHLLLPVLLLIFCILCRIFLYHFEKSSPLEELSEEMALHMLTNNPLELHYSIAYPEQMGLEELSKDLVPFQKDFYLLNRTYWNTCAETLNKIKPETLHTEDIFTYDLLSKYIHIQIENLNFPYYENPLTCSGGIQTQLPILLSEYTLRSKQDIENYLLLLSQIPDYLSGLETYVTLQETNGIYICRQSWEEVQAQCRSLFPEDQLKTDSHFLQTSFETRIKELSENNLITKQEAAAYIKRNNALLTSKIVPAYCSLADTIAGLQGSPTLKGLSSYPNGKAYYALLLADRTCSSRSVEEIQTMLYERYHSLYEEYIALLQKNSVVQNFSFPLEEPIQMLQFLYTQSQSAFPVLKEVTKDKQQQIDLKTVDGILAQSSAPAFYMTPPIDANDKHTIYINPDAQMQSLDLFTTLAHEGFPGHLYQTVYSQSFLKNTDAVLLRQLLYYGGFTEGWAIYAELYSYELAMTLCDEKLTDTLLADRLNREIQLCLSSILDIFIHYQGADVEDVQKLLKSLGLNVSSAQTIYEVICDDPANYPKYYVGYLEILNLKETAKTLWKEDYSDYAFHKWLLETGGGDFESLTDKLLRDSKDNQT